MKLSDLREHKQPVRPTRTDTVEFFELCDSMELMGQLTPLLVRPDGMIIDGHRRFRAAKRLGWSDIDVNVKDLTAKEELVAQIRLNDLTVDEYRRAIMRLSDENSLDNLSSIGYALGRNVDWVADILGLETLSKVIREATDKGLVHVKVAMLLAKLPKEKQRSLFTDSLNSDFVQQLQQIVRKHWEDKLDRRATKRGRPDTPYLRTERAVINEVKTPTDAMRLLSKEKARTPYDGWKLALLWALRLDPESLKRRNEECQKTR